MSDIIERAERLLVDWARDYEMDSRVDGAVRELVEEVKRLRAASVEYEGDDET